MATRYVSQATKQIGGVYDQQINQLQGQVPAIQNLYAQLSQALGTQADQQIQSGTQDILESASQRGVLRSTLPVDAQQALQAQIGTALTQSQGQLGLEQLQNINALQQQIGGLRTQRAGNIADLARALEGQDLERQQLALQKLQANRDYQLQKQQLAMQRSRSSAAPSISSKEYQQSALGAIAQSFTPGRDGYVSPNQWNKFRKEWAGLGLSTKVFDEQFSGYINPAHFKLGKRYGDYSVSAAVKKALTKG